MLLRSVVLRTALFGLFIAASAPLPAQVPQTAIQSIRDEFNRIEKDGSLKKRWVTDVELFLDGTPDGGAELIGYYSGKTIRKIHCWIGLSNGNELTDYYFRQGALIFAYRRFYQFQPDGESGLDRTKTRLVREERYYFQGGTLIKTSLSGADVKLPQDATALQRDAREFKRVLDQQTNLP